MKQVCRWMLLLSGVALMINGAILAIVANFNFGVVCILALGICLGGYGVWLEQVNKHTAHGVLRVVKYGIFGLFGLIVCAILFLGLYGQRDTATGEEEVLIVLGGGIRGETVSRPLKYRLDVAAEYAKNNPHALLVVTGGQGFQEDITEALAMERYLTGCGVSKDRIIQEGKATSTYENFVYTKQLLAGWLPEGYSCAFVTSDFHVYRTTRLAHLAGLRPTWLHAPIDWYTALPSYLRECMAIIKMWMFKR